MRFRSGQSRTEFALFARLRAAGWTMNRQRFFLCDLHAYTMRGCAPTRWSIVIIARSCRRRIISVEQGGPPSLSAATANVQISPRRSSILILGRIPCSISWLRKQTKFLNHHRLMHECRPIRRAPNSHPHPGPHMSLTPISLRCPRLHISLTARSLPWMNFLTNLTKTSSCGLDASRVEARTI
jgi:hypothetical protein